MSAPLPTTAFWQALRDLGVGDDAADVAARLGVARGPERRWLLTLRDGELAHRVMLLGPPALLGRSPSCDVVVDDPRVDAVHLEIAPHDDGATFRAAGAGGFDCHGARQHGSVDVAFGTPVFLDNFLMLTIEPCPDDARPDGPPA